MAVAYSATEHRSGSINEVSIGCSLIARLLANALYCINRFRHPNLVELMGYHKSDIKMALVYEYLPGGSLYFHLHDVHSIV